MLTVALSSFRGYRDHRVEPAFMPTRKLLSGRSLRFSAIAVSSLLLPMLLAFSVFVSVPALATAAGAGDKTADDQADGDKPADKAKDKKKADKNPGDKTAKSADKSRAQRAAARPSAPRQRGSPAHRSGCRLHQSPDSPGLAGKPDRPVARCRRRRMAPPGLARSLRPHPVLEGNRPLPQG